MIKSLPAITVGAFKLPDIPVKFAQDPGATVILFHISSILTI